MSSLQPVAVAVMIAATVLLSSIARPAQGEGPARSPELDAEVRRMLTELEAPTRARRSAAVSRLLEMGPAILDALPPPELIATVSAREAVDRVRHELERRQARESTRASRVTLSGEKPLAEWLADIARGTGNRLDARALPPALRDTPIAFSGRPQEFWPLLDDLASRQGFAFAASPESRGLALKAQAEAGSPSAREAVVGYSGPFRLSASAMEQIIVSERREPALSIPTKRLARGALSIQVEPRLRPIFLQYAIKEIRAETATSKMLAPFSPDASYELPFGEPGGPAKLQLEYRLPEGALPAAVDLAGKFRVTLAAGQAVFRFDELAKHADGKTIGIERRRGGVTVTLERLRREPGADGTVELRVRILVAYDSGGPAFESHRTWMLHNEAFLEKPDGERLPVNGGFETALETDGAVGMEYRFIHLPDPLPEWVFVYVAPTVIVEVPVEFALKSIPLKAPR